MGSLIAVSLPDGRLIEYVTDGKGRRIGKMVNGVLTKQWIYRDQLKPVAELDGAGNLVSEFIYGTKVNVPGLVVRGGVTYRMVTDQLGSPVFAVNTANSSDVPFQATYTAFGERTLVAGTDDWMPFGFAGGIYDFDTKLMRFVARDYNPAIGRWVSKDPIRFNRGQVNIYVYVGNDPVNRRDPSGLDYASTTDCTYYEARCYQNGGSYYCVDAQWYCNAFGDNPWSNCTRSCLQTCDASHNPRDDNFSPNYDDKNGQCVGLAPETPDNSGPWNPTSGDFDCHAICYSSCWAVIATGGP
jgi:RHS repeat-associated protein